MRRRQKRRGEFTLTRERSRGIISLELHSNIKRNLTSVNFASTVGGCLQCFISLRLLAANPALSDQSARILLERGLVRVEGGASLSLLLLSERNNLASLSHQLSAECLPLL